MHFRPGTLGVACRNSIVPAASECWFMIQSVALAIRKFCHEIPEWMQLCTRLNAAVHEEITKKAWWNMEEVERRGIQMNILEVPQEYPVIPLHIRTSKYLAKLPTTWEQNETSLFISSYILLYRFISSLSIMILTQNRSAACCTTLPLAGVLVVLTTRHISVPGFPCHR